jgi:hypothetical protein
VSNLSKSLSELLRALGGAIKSLYRLAPAVAVMLIAISIFFVVVMATTPGRIMNAVVFIVFVVSITIYGRTKNYGEAALALVIGLLAAFTIKWTPQWFALFAGAYIGFTVLIFLISSVRIASRLEDILRQASIFIDEQNYKDVEAQLKKTIDEDRVGAMDPIEKAECIRFLAFKKFPVDLMGPALKSIGQLSIITKMEPHDIASFVYDLYRINVAVGSPSFMADIDKMFLFIKDLPSTPEEFFESFRRTRKLILTGRAGLNQYLQVLEKAIYKGLTPEEIALLMDTEFPAEE